MDALLQLNEISIAIVAALLSVTTTLIAVILLSRQKRLLRRYRTLLNGSEGVDLERMLLAQSETLQQTNQHLAELAKQVERLTRDAELHVQRTGIVRFNAFPDTGSDLSFSIALLDAHNSGFVISSLYGRSESRTYAKPVKNGTSTYTLSDEEKQAIEVATTRSSR